MLQFDLGQQVDPDVIPFSSVLFFKAIVDAWEIKMKLSIPIPNQK